MSQVHASMALPSIPAKPGMHIIGPATRANDLIYFFARGVALPDGRRVTGYAHDGTVYEFTFSDRSTEAVDLMEGMLDLPDAWENCQ